MNEKDLDGLFAYAVQIRRNIHQYPEVGFDLPRTAALVGRELDGMGISHTDRYGACSVVADIGPSTDRIALRADMDALPVEEKNDLPYRSRIKGNMHACGHDAHTAILLAVAKYLKAHEGELRRGIRLIFQPAEESAISGAKMMVDHGVMDGISEVLCTHVENTLSAGRIGICKGDYMAACIPATVRFFGKSAHATLPDEGKDAIAMAVAFYTRMRDEIREEAKDQRYIWSVGRFSGGSAHNVIADQCEMDISFRFYDMSFAARISERAHTAATEIAASFGGRAELVFDMSTGPVHNDASIHDTFKAIVEAKGLPIEALAPRMSSEDFGWYLTKAPGLIFRIGTRNEALGCTALAHTSEFMIDEEGMRTGIRAFTSYALR